MDVNLLTRVLTRKVGDLVSSGGSNSTSTTTTTSGSSATTTQSTTTPSSTESTETNFAAFLEKNLNKASDNTVSEEDLYAGIVRFSMQKLKGDEGLKKFDDALAKSKIEYPRSIEEATKFALMQLQESNYISYEEGNKINAESFQAAQLDSNKEALFDSTGGANDPTKAVEAIEKAIASAKAIFDQFDAGTQKALERPVAVSNTGIESVPTKIGILASAVTKEATVSTAAASGTPVGGVISPRGSIVDGAGGFLFKPVTENEKKLAVLSPDGVGPLIKSMRLVDANGNLIEEGRFTSFGDDGRNRAKFAFKKQGGQYENNITVEIHYIDGTVGKYSIPDPSKRYD
jgi:hypothetical protein